MDARPTVYERVKYRQGKASDAPAIRALLDGQLRRPLPDSLYTELGATLREDAKKDGVRLIVGCAVDSVKGEASTLAGVVVLRLAPLAKLRAAPAAGAGAPELPCDVLETTPADAYAVRVVAVAIGSRYRRYGFGSELLEETVVIAAAREPGLEVAFAMVEEDDEAARGFLGSQRFAPLGRVPGAFPTLPAAPGKPGSGAGPADGLLLALPLRALPLAEFVPSRKGVLPDLTSPSLQRVKRMPKWARDLLLQFGLPIAFVFVLFCISYALVVLGPFQGISGEDWLMGKRGGAPGSEPGEDFSELGPDELEDL